MGRTRVDPSKRLRAMQACSACRDSKKRCDSKMPCTNCLKRKIGDDCTYNSERPRIPGNKTLRARAPSQNSELEKSLVGHDSDRSRMLWSSRGSQVFVGRSASLSFLHMLRDILTCYMGHSTFTDDSRRGFMLETERNSDHTAETPCSHTFSDNCELVDIFFAATCGVLDVLSKDQVLRALQQTHLETSSLQAAVINATIAIGAQCRANGAQDNRCSKLHAIRAQKIAFENMLEDPSIDMIRVFVLLAFYMLGACRRNAASMYVGVAARAAHVIGLHHEDSYRSIPQEDQESFSNTWKSVRFLDLVIGSVLGRPTATCHLERTTVSIPVKNGSHEDASHRRLALQASLDAWYLVDETVHTFYRQGNTDVASAKTLLSKLEDWSANLSPSLKSYTPTSCKVRNQEVVIGNMHVSCSYYFAVMLVARKFFVSHQMARLAAKRIAAGESPESSRQGVSEFPELAQTCIGSAKLMLHTCRDIMEADMLLDNMCLLKAWIFAAGLVLGLAMFADDRVEPDLADAFNAATSVLYRLSACSPQAQLYFEILEKLLKAIRDHHQRSTTMSEKKPEKFVEKIFTFGDAGSDQQETYPIGVTQDLNTNRVATPINEWPMSSTGIGPFSSFTQSNVYDELHLGDIDAVAGQLWDDFLLEGFPVG